MPRSRPLRLDECDDVLTPWELARVLKVGKNRIYEDLEAGKIPAIKLGRQWRIPKERLRRYLNGGKEDEMQNQLSVCPN